ncbi:MAG TPA: hypothetical protein PK360_21825, partial [bacterium]|nr:hypothetical protein [bacterium]
KKSNRLFILASVFCGMAMGTKFNGLLFGFVPLWLFLAIRYFVWKKGSWRDGWVKLALFTGIAWCLYSPWMIKSFVYTGNPMYPMLEEIFPTREEFVHAMRSNAHNHGLNILKSKSLGEFVGQVETNILWLLYNADLIFFLGLMALFLLLILRKKRWLYPSTALLLAYLLFPLLWGSDIARLYAANYGVVVLCVALAVSWLARQIQGGRWLNAVILISLVFTFTQQRLYYLSSPNIRWFGDVHLSEPARRAWLNERGEVVKEEGILGIALEKVSEEEALGGMTGSGGADVTEIASVAVSVPIEAPERVQRLRLRIGGVDAKAGLLDGDRQRFEPPVLTITRE